MYYCMNTSMEIVSVCDVGQVAHVPLVKLSNTVDEFWKYVVVECADLRIGQQLRGLSRDRPDSEQTVFQFFFGDVIHQPFKREYAHHKNLQHFHILIKNATDNVTSRITGVDGMAMYLFMLQRADFDRRITRQAFDRRLSTIPHNMAVLKKAMPVRDCFSLDKTLKLNINSFRDDQRVSSREKYQKGTRAFQLDIDGHKHNCYIK